MQTGQSHDCKHKHPKDLHVRLHLSVQLFPKYPVGQTSERKKKELKNNIPLQKSPSL